MSEADIGYGITVEAEDSPGAGTFTALAEVYSVTPPETSVDQVDVTHYGSPNRSREFKPALSDNGTASAEMNYVPGSDTDQRIRAMKDNGEVIGFQVTYEDGTMVEFTGFVTSYAQSLPVDDRMTATIQIKVTGEVTLTPAGGGT